MSARLSELTAAHVLERPLAVQHFLRVTLSRGRPLGVRLQKAALSKSPSLPAAGGYVCRRPGAFVHQRQRRIGRSRQYVSAAATAMLALRETNQNAICQT
jgi:hypothetical protein